MVVMAAFGGDDGKGSSYLSTEPTLKLVVFFFFFFLFLLRTKGVILVLCVKNLFLKTD